MARSIAFAVPVCLAATFLTACGGGGGGGSSSVLPSTSVQPPAGTGATPAMVALSILVPTVAPGSHGRRPRYVSGGTKSVAVTYAGSRQTADCGTTCALQLSVSPGTVTFDVGLYDAAGGTGHLLSSGQTTATIVQGRQNTINISFAGVVASVALTLGSGSVTAGTPATIPVTVAAKDAAGYTIVGSDPYANPISVSLDASGAASLSATSLSAPSAPLTLAYNGNAGVAAVHVSASVAGTAISAQPVTLSVQSAPLATPPPGNVPVREATWYYYGANDVNSTIPASWMAAHTDYVESSDDPKFAQSFKDAGGKYAAYYTDPAYSPYCFAPFTPGTKACTGALADYADDSAWFHGADGTRIRRYMDAHFGYQEALNPGSPAAHAAYQHQTDDLLRRAPGLDYFFADDSGGAFIGGDGTVMTGWFWGFNAPATEITTDAAFIPAEQSMLAVPARPVIVNGIDPQTLRPSYGGKWIDSPNVAGVNFEGCYSEANGSGVAAGGRWVNQSNGLLMTYAHRSKAICMMYAAATPANRIYDLASWWMTYTEPYGVAAPMVPTSDGFTVVPEFEIVPRQPRTTATADVAVLRAAGGAYVREFAACYQAGAPIGACAAVVNPSSSSAPLPALAGKYTTALVVDDRSAYTGGKATWSGAVPSALPPLSAAILR